MGAFNYPTPGFETGLPFDGLRLLAATADVGGEAELIHGAPHFGKVVAPVSSTGQALVQAHTLGILWDGRRSGHRQTVHRNPHQLHVVAVGPVHRQTHWNTLGFGQQATLDAPLTPVGGVGAGFFPPKGDLVMAPSILNQLQSRPFSSS